MKKPRKIAIYKARTGEKSKKAGIYFYQDYLTNTKLIPAINRFVTITAVEYDFLTITAGIKKRHKTFGNLIKVNYLDYQELVGKAQDKFY